MASLTGNSIDTSYQGLIKTIDNASVDPTILKQLTDGVGGTLPIEVSQIETKFASGSSVDFTGTTVTGLPSGGGASAMNGYIVPGRPLTNGWSFPSQWALPFPAREGQTLDQLNIHVHTAFDPGTTIDLYLYNSQGRTTPVADSMIIPFTKLATLATGVAIDVSGLLNITLTPYTLPETGCYYLYAIQSGTGSGLWLEAGNDPSSGNSWVNFLGWNPFNSNTAFAARHSCTGAAANAPATIAASGSGLGSLVRPAHFWFKNSN